MKTLKWDCPSCGYENKTPRPIEHCDHVCRNCEQIVTFRFLVTYMRRWRATCARLSDFQEQLNSDPRG